jgi:hypothetical protein
MLSEKAHQLIQRAAKNTGIDVPKLRKEIYSLGILYVHKFNDRVKRRNRHDLNV